MDKKKEKLKKFVIWHTVLHRSMGILLVTTLLFNALPVNWTTALGSENVDMSCKHHKEHTIDCGYSEEDNTSCEYKCYLCSIEELIAALPDEVTESNTEKVSVQLDKILDLYRELTEEEQEQIDISYCLKLQETLDTSNVPNSLATGDFQFTTNGESVTFTEEECGDNCQGHIITQSTNSFAGRNATILVKSGTHNITFSGLNLKEAKVGIMSGAMMNLIVDGTNSISASTGMAGIYVPVDTTLIIEGQNTSSLNVSGHSGGAGIGGAYYAPNDEKGNFNCGTVIINGGTITATGGSCCAGIGGGSGDVSNPIAGNGGTITVNGGIVTATGGNDTDYYGGAGIGGGVYNGKSGYGGTLTINGGLVTLNVGTYNDQWGISYGFGRGNGNTSNAGTLTLADENYLTLADGTALDPNSTYYIISNLTVDMITVPLDMHYTSANMAAEIAKKVTLSGKEICGQTFEIDMEGWSLSVTKKSDLEYTAVYTHAEKGSVSKPVIILPCLHGDGAALTYHEKVEADCTHTGILEYWDCSICEKNFSDKDGQTEIMDTEIPIAAHTLTHHEKVEADCTHTGVLEYWNCSVCEKNFSDKDGQTEITDIEIPTTAHTLTYHEKIEANCIQAGNMEYWDCSVCGKKFSDQDCQTEISDTNVEIQIKPHTLTYHARVEAGCLTEGIIEYWNCSVCDKLFSDKDGTKEVMDVKIPATGHNYNEWKSNGNGTHTRTCQAPSCDSTETKDCSGGTATYMKKAICEICNREYGEFLKDSGVPTGEISISTSKWNSFLNTITFGLFFKNTEEVTITAEDQESGVKSISYYISDSGLSEEEVKALTTEWTDVDGDTAIFSISEDKSCVVYARITDKQGNVTYISSNGMVFDGTRPSITGVVEGETYCTPQTITITDDYLKSVTVNGKEVTLLNDTFTLDLASGLQIIEAMDKAGNTTTVTVTVAHTLTHHEKVEADCTQVGNIEYWDCSVCRKKFSDQDGQTEISNTEIPIATHTLTYYTRIEADCTQAGNIEYWGCSICGKKFSDEDGQTEITATEIPIIAHTLTHHARVEADCTQSGNMEYWDCSVCGKKFSDQDGTKEVTDVKIPATEHKYSDWQSNNDGTHTRNCQVLGCDFTETENCSGGIASYIDKAVCEICKHEYGEILKDTDVPTGEISIGTNKWNSFLSTINFELFFKETEQVMITAKDQESGVKSISYYISSSKMQEEEIKALEAEWTVVNAATTTFNISREGSSVVYAKIVDHQENVTYISSDGLIFDETPPSITGVVEGEIYCTPQIITVTDDYLESVTVNGKAEVLSNNKFTLGSASNTQIIEARDKAGNISTVTVIVNAEHNYEANWKSNTDSHWHECTCGNKSDIAVHIENDGIVTKPATKTEKGIRTYQCRVCGYVMRTEEIDMEALTGTIEISGNKWSSFLSAVTFGLYKNTQEVISITSNDNEDVVKIYYLIATEKTTYSLKELEANENWTLYNDFAKPTLKKNTENVVYAKLENTVGNVTYISTNGIIEDEVPPVASLTVEKVIENSVTFQVSSSEDGTYYLVISTSEYTDIESIKNAENVLTGKLTADTMIPIFKGELSKNIDYNVYLVIEDYAHNFSEIVKQVVTTKNKPMSITTSITGTPAYGEILTASAKYKEKEDLHFIYQWYRSNSVNVEEAILEPIENATNSTYLVQKNDVNKYLVVKATLNMEEYSSSAFSSSIEIQPRTVRINASARDKIYDKTTKADIIISLTGILAGDNITAKADNAVFEDANAGEKKTVNITDITLNGNDAVYYQLSSTKATATATIKKAPIAPNTPNNSDVWSVANSIEIVGNVTGLPDGWVWSDKDKTKILTVGEEETVSAIYIKEDANNYEIISLEIKLKRSTCNHDNIEIRNKVAATCTEAGYTGDTYCLDCDNKIQTGSKIEPLGHKEVEDSAIAPNCTEVGKTAGSHCSVCDEILVEQSIVPALGHNYNEGIITKKPTIKEEGEKTFTCSICGDSRTEPIEKLPTPEHKHDYKSKITKQPTYSETGVCTFTCSVCGNSYTEEIPRLTLVQPPSTSISTPTNSSTVNSGTSTETQIPSDSNTEAPTPSVIEPEQSNSNSIVEIKPDGTKVETITESQPDNTMKKIVIETKIDGSIIETKEVIAIDNSAILSTVVETNASGNSIINSVIKTGVSDNFDIVSIPESLQREITADDRMNSVVIEVTDTTIKSVINERKKTVLTVEIPVIENISVKKIVLTKESIDTVKETRKGLKINIVGDSTKNNTLDDYSVVIPAKQLARIDSSIKEINVTINAACVTNIVESTVKNIVTKVLNKNKGKKNKTCVVSLASNKGVITNMKVTIPVTKKTTITKGSKVYVYKYDAKAGKLVETANYKKTVTQDGSIMIIVSSGTDYIISAKKLSGNKVQTIKDGISVSVSKKTAKVGKTIRVKVSLPSTVNTKSEFETEKATITYKSSNSKVASVSKSGVIITKKRGIVTIKTVIKLASGQKITKEQKITVK